MRTVPRSATSVRRSPSHEFFFRDRITRCAIALPYPADSPRYGFNATLAEGMSVAGGKDRVHYT